MTAPAAPRIAARRAKATASAGGNRPSIFGIVIKDALVYFDTVCIWIPRYLERWERDTLDGLCGRLNYRPTWRAANRWMWGRGYRVRLVLQQPTMDAFKFLKQRLRGRPAPMINHVDCAFDLVTS